MDLGISVPFDDVIECGNSDLNCLFDRPNPAEGRTTVTARNVLRLIAARRRR